MQYILKSVICLKSLYVLTLRYLNPSKIIEPITSLCNSIKKDKEKKNENITDIQAFPFCLY